MKTRKRKSNQEATIVGIDDLLRAGQMCSNVCYNLAQRDYIPSDDALSMTQSYKAWDEASRALRARLNG